LACANGATISRQAKELCELRKLKPTMLDNLQAFIDVAKTGSFSGVAKSRNVAVSSISRQVDALEASLGIRLFHRSSRRLLLTDAGEQFLPRAVGIVSELDDARAALLDAQAEPRGVLSVTAPAAFGRLHVAPAAATFLQRYPLIELDLHCSDQWVDLVLNRTDVAVRSGTLPDSDLTATELAPLRRLACASPEYLRRHGRPAKPEELLQHSCLTLSPSSRIPSSWWAFDGVNKGKPLSVQGRLRSDDTATLVQGAVAGLGVVHLASWLVSDMIASGQLVCLFPDALPPTEARAAAIHAVRLKGRSHAAKAQLFISHLKAAFGSPTYWDRAVSGARSPSGAVIGQRGS
jgi:DNA-binding transcriptional LysR family regulator